MPITAEHSAQLKSEHADVKSTGSGRGGGASVAAAFLKRFVRADTRWAHLDIAGVGMLNKPHAQFCAHGTGFGAELFTHLIETWPLDTLEIHDNDDEE